MVEGGIGGAPSSMMVAVPLPPFQHSPTLGHCASSHTVTRPSPRRLPDRYSNRSPCGARCRSHAGFFSPALSSAREIWPVQLSGLSLRQYAPF